MKRLVPLFLVALLAPLSAQAASQCVLLVGSAVSRTLVNTCDNCRVAKIEVTRPGASTPVNRAYTLAEKSKMPLPLKNANKVRVLGDEPCAPASGSNAASQEQCLVLTANKQGDPVLLNGCDGCRMAQLEWKLPDGVAVQENQPVVGRSYTALQQKADAAQLRVVGEQACKN